jgi:hypothetical protein
VRVPSQRVCVCLKVLTQSQRTGGLCVLCRLCIVSCRVVCFGVIFGLVLGKKSWLSWAEFGGDDDDGQQGSGFAMIDQGRHFAGCFSIGGV